MSEEKTVVRNRRIFFRITTEGEYASDTDNVIQAMSIASTEERWAHE